MAKKSQSHPTIYVFAHTISPETGIAYSSYDRNQFTSTGSVNPFDSRRNQPQKQWVIDTIRNHIQKGYRLVLDKDHVGRSSPLPESARRYLLSQLNTGGDNGRKRRV